MRGLPLLLGALACAACVHDDPGPAGPAGAPTPQPAALPPAPTTSPLITDVPHVRQKPDFCGEACAAAYLEKLGGPVDQDWVFDQSGLDPSLGRGCYAPELARALTKIGFWIGDVWQRVETDADLAAQFGALHADLAAGVPSIVCMYYDDPPNDTEHFRLVLGYDAATDEVIYHEPAEDDGAYRRMPRARFLALWPLVGRGHRTTVRMRLEPGELDYGRVATALTAADYAQHVRALKARLPAGFTVVVEQPFVVVGNDGPERVRASAERTVRWSVAKLKQDFFAADPDEIIDIWLFKDDPSYRRGAKQFFDDEPDTPYGYYSESHRALVMNIATGGGTLVHEIVHPFVRRNFPACPSWFNEGLGSLYEQSADRDGHIIGLTNWRLAGLKQAIAAGELPSFAALTATTEHEFYAEDPGSNYAQARYLLYYLQERGLLVPYYAELTANQDADPTGYETLQRVLNEDDMEAFQRRWEAWVMRLTFP